MATSAPASCPPEVLQQIRRTLSDHPVAELGDLRPAELNSLAELICALSQGGGAFRAQFERLNSREDLVALAASHGIPVQPSLLERFEQLARVSAADALTDAQLASVTAGAGQQDAAVHGLQLMLLMLPSETRF